jgi:hypothetical protein
MLIYDINSFPDDLDISVWYGLFEKGLAVYDSHKGVVPFQFDHPELSLIDIRELSASDLVNITEHISKMNEEYKKLNDADLNKIRENNKKLIEYLKSINNTKI